MTHSLRFPNIRRAAWLFTMVCSVMLLSACHSGVPKSAEPIRTLIVGGFASHDFNGAALS